MRKKKGRGEQRLTGGVEVSARAKKRKIERERRAGAGELGGSAGLAGSRGERVRFSFFSFLFQTSF
jgi:hypothetical protein